jgi:hypothetical protein
MEAGEKAGGMAQVEEHLYAWLVSVCFWKQVLVTWYIQIVKPIKLFTGYTSIKLFQNEMYQKSNDTCF